MFRLAAAFWVMISVLSASPAFSDPDKQAATQQCEKVMALVAHQEGKDVGENPCAAYSYPKEFWMCVEKRTGLRSPFRLAVQRCERVLK